MQMIFIFKRPEGGYVHGSNETVRIDIDKTNILIYIFTRGIFVDIMFWLIKRKRERRFYNMTQQHLDLLSRIYNTFMLNFNKRRGHSFNG